MLAVDIKDTEGWKWKQSLVQSNGNIRLLLHRTSFKGLPATNEQGMGGYERVNRVSQRRKLRETKRGKRQSHGDEDGKRKLHVGEKDGKR